jgi:hypothetical protein
MCVATGEKNYLVFTGNEDMNSIFLFLFCLIYKVYQTCLCISLSPYCPVNQNLDTIFLAFVLTSSIAMPSPSAIPAATATHLTPLHVSLATLRHVKIGKRTIRLGLRQQDVSDSGWGARSAPPVLMAMTSMALGV